MRKKACHATQRDTKLLVWVHSWTSFLPLLFSFIRAKSAAKTKLLPQTQDKQLQHSTALQRDHKHRKLRCPSARVCVPTAD